MDPLIEFALFLFSWMLVILAVSTLGRKASAWLRKRMGRALDPHRSGAAGRYQS